MRRITRRIGMFGGPGAIVKAAGAKTRRGTREAPHQSRPPQDAPDVSAPQAEAAPEKKSWLSWFRGSKRNDPT